MPESQGPYPPEAYAENGVLWWQLATHPGTTGRYGDERKLAAYLAFNYECGDTFTMSDLREGLGTEVIPNDAEHLNRRLRELRKDGWIIPTNKDDRSLGIGVYRVDGHGWHPGSGEPRPQRGTISNATRRRVIDRDGRRCVICGVGSGEPYPGEPHALAVLTVGHRVPRDMGGSNSESNLQAECKRCNESVRQEIANPETLEEILPDVRRLKTTELTQLAEWLQQGHRTRNRLDQVQDRVRSLSSEERKSLLSTVLRMLGPKPSALPSDTSPSP